MGYYTSEKELDTFIEYAKRAKIGIVEIGILNGGNIHGIM
uniref:Uncharacterized protein n=1 Tax=Candidatus Kentrum sp. LFY TaxID=2126342 RepID=A0A450V0W6_9GAMM|nr:MAG: hypothetical protein BECKLFY1418B_GA0070995_11185 [Candidatus Kentron sp. LFY]